MRAVIQRIARCTVKVGEETVGSCGKGLLVYLGVCPEDTTDDVDYISKKVADVRIFQDDQGKMNLSVSDIGGSICVVSQFTLFGDTRKGRRPSFIGAAPPEMAEALYERSIAFLSDMGFPVVSGRFGAHMQIDYVNDGPVTLLIDSKKLF